MSALSSQELDKVYQSVDALSEHKAVTVTFDRFHDLIWVAFLSFAIALFTGLQNEQENKTILLHSAAAFASAKNLKVIVWIRYSCLC